MAMLSSSCLQIWRGVPSSSQPAEKEGHGMSGWGCREGVWEWNEPGEKGWGLLFQGRGELGELGRFGPYGVHGGLWLGERGGGEGQRRAVGVPCRRRMAAAPLLLF
jgi:hypothetical protein